MIDVAPTGHILDHDTIDQTGFAFLIGATPMKVQGISATDVVTAEVFYLHMFCANRAFVFGDKYPVIEQLAFVGPAHICHGRKVHVHVIGVHEHDVSTVKNCIVF